MAKGQKRTSKEAKKPKTADKKASGPKYMMPAELVQTGKLGASRPGKK